MLFYKRLLNVKSDVKNKDYFNKWLENDQRMPAINTSDGQNNRRTEYYHLF